MKCKHCGRDIRLDPDGAPAWLDSIDTSYLCPGGEDYEGQWHEPEDSDSFTATLTDIRYDGGTVAIGTAIGEQGDTIRFGMDWRVAHHLRDVLLASDEDVQVTIEGWQVLSVT